MRISFNIKVTANVLKILYKPHLLSQIIFCWYVHSLLSLIYPRILIRDSSGTFGLLLLLVLLVTKEAKAVHALLMVSLERVTAPKDSYVDYINFGILSIPKVSKHRWLQGWTPGNLKLFLWGKVILISTTHIYIFKIPRFEAQQKELS